MIFKTIQKTHDEFLPDIPVSRLRTWLKENRLPGVYSGTRFLVDVERLMEQLAAEAERM